MRCESGSLTAWNLWSSALVILIWFVVIWLVRICVWIRVGFAYLVYIHFIFMDGFVSYSSLYYDNLVMVPEDSNYD